MARAATMRDVASRAGVSHQTVSRVLNDSPAVLPETRERVLAAISDLGYRRNVAARALVTRRSQTIGVVNFGDRLYGPTAALYAIEQAARQQDYFVSMLNDRALDGGSIGESLGRLAEQGVEGVVVIAPQQRGQEALARLEAFPAVVIDGHPDCGAPRVYVDQELGGRLATEHLLEQGVETVWHLAGPPDWVEAESRVRGWRAALADAGRAEPPLLRGDWSADSGYALGQKLARDPEVRAVFVANDQMALGFLRALREAGRQCPGDVLVVGYDDLPESAFFWPPLTTVRQDFEALGRRSIALLLSQIEGNRAHHSETIAPSLVVRTSSAPPRGRVIRMRTAGPRG
ncbi:LacI family transcriptional regulator [Motilibacter rhizosphaerae]|uniref:LacI family transcriptional regulator n=1 Tax=Motilibacter rhizosphaerae TaxID=598652 RepID=A0A4Q7NQ36_9ACTN|nr:LacI family DNA-binding transcriptional regulator [Motilibacter rhizosphaerae]RZS87421.1 LacI family transcriptional regulator [Motilibacter rhizosphaerae]